MSEKEYITAEESKVPATENITGQALNKSSNRLLTWMSLNRHILLWAVWGLLIIYIVIGVILWRFGYLEPRTVGLSGVFLINLAGSATIFIPIPGIAAACGAASPGLHLNLIYVALLGAAGSTLGEGTSYLIGYALANSKRGENIRQNHKSYQRVKNLVEKRGGLTLFILSALPNPIFDVAGVVAGSLGYKLSSFFLLVGVGKLIKYTYTVFACQMGIIWIQRLLSV